MSNLYTPSGNQVGNHVNGGRFSARNSMDQLERNDVLAGVSAPERERLREMLTPCSFPVGRTLYESGDILERVYFPISGLVSLVLISEEGTQVEAGVVGREGVVGGSAVLANAAPLSRAMIQIEGRGFWMSAPNFRDEFRRGGALQGLMLRYGQVMIAQTSQAALCNRIHTVEERLSRWLLTIRDRISSDELNITQEFIAHMLGTRRSGVTVAAGVLRQSGFIQYTRGHITIIDDKGLEGCACECYHILRREFDALKK